MIDLYNEDSIYGAINAVMLRNPDMVRAYMGITMSDREDLMQELVRNFFEKSIHRWDETKKVQYKTYIYTCARNHLHNMTDKCCRRRKREQSMWEYWFTILDERSMDGVNNTYLREENYRDGELLQKVMFEADLTDEEYQLLVLFTTAKGKIIGRGMGKFFADKMNIPHDYFYKLRKSLFKKIRIQYRIQ
jgi:DNA-directed RNA polymerase specialized sigma24 family protein